MSAPIIIAAGGTGGHFFPAEALAAELMARGHKIVLMTDARSGGNNSETFAHCERLVLSGAGLAGRGLIKAGRGALALAAGTLQARRALRRLQPSAIVGFGGYPTVAPVLASLSLNARPKVILHEQNAVLGRANRALSRFADVQAISFAATRKLSPHAPDVLTGNPVRPAIIAQAGQPALPHDETFHLLILGGSLGARVFSSLIPDAIALLPAELLPRLRITQQCRADDLATAQAAYAKLGVAVDLSPFFADVAERLAGADLVITRAGASTVAELAAIGRAAILVPLPNAIDDHQTANAQALVDAGGAWMMPQAQLTAAALADALAALITNPAALHPIANAAAQFGRIDATMRLADVVEHTIHSKEIAV